MQSLAVLAGRVDGGRVDRTRNNGAEEDSSRLATPRDASVMPNVGLLTNQTAWMPNQIDAVNIRIITGTRVISR